MRRLKSPRFSRRQTSIPRQPVASVLETWSIDLCQGLLPARDIQTNEFTVGSDEVVVTFRTDGGESVTTSVGDHEATTTGPFHSVAFTGLEPGSYAVRPNDARCGFGPDVMNLNHLGANAVQDFRANCR